MIAAALPLTGQLSANFGGDRSHGVYSAIVPLGIGWALADASPVGTSILRRILTPIAYSLTPYSPSLLPMSIDQVQPPLKFIPPAFNPWVLRLCRLCLPWVLRSQTSIVQLEVDGLDRLVDLYDRFALGKVRLLFAFRHSSVDDPLCLFKLFSQLLPEAAARAGRSLPTTHFHFLYDRGIPLWAGEWVGQAYAKLGGVPIRRGRLDLIGLRTAREILVSGQFPMAAAPEGATNGHNQVVSPLEPGVAQLGFWCAEDLAKLGRRSEQVLVVPLGIQYHYVTPPWGAIEGLIQQLEWDCGVLPLKTDPKADFKADEKGEGQSGEGKRLYPRLARLGEELLTQMERFYEQYYRRSLSNVEVKSNPDLPFADRLQGLLNAALVVAESDFGIVAKGSMVDRCRRLEQAAWDRIYREDLGDLEQLSPLDLGLANRLAEEASFRLWHMRLAESFVAVSGNYVRDWPTAERFADTTLLIWDVVTRLKGGNPTKRPSLGPQRAQLTIGVPLSVSDRFESYRASRRSARQAVEGLTFDLQRSLELMIVGPENGRASEDLQ